MALVRALVVVGAALVAAWSALVLLLALTRPRGVDVREARRFVPDLARLVRDLARDATVPRGVRWRLGALAVYLSLPIDLVPDVVPILGYADDVVVVALVLRSVVRRAGPAAIDRHWRGSDQGRRLVRRLAGIETGP